LQSLLPSNLPLRYVSPFPRQVQQLMAGNVGIRLYVPKGRSQSGEKT
jgi:hypothetical protein